MKYEFLNEKQNKVLKKYFSEGTSNFSRTEYQHLKRIKEICKQIVTSYSEAHELLLKLV